MKTLQLTLKEAMKNRALGIRGLEREIKDQLGEEYKISRNQIHEYLQGKRAPTYQTATVISTVLGLDRRDFLLMTYFARQEQREEAEKERFLEYCHDAGIKVSTRDLME